MGRRPTANLNLPPMMRARRRRDRTYYYYDTGARPRVEMALGSDYTLAVQESSKLHQAKPTVAMTVGWAIQKYRASHEFAGLARGTQADYNYALDKIDEHFGDAPLDQVTPPHIALYLDKRSQSSRHRALRERAVFSMIFRWCMARGFCTANPAGAIKTRRLPGRKHVDIAADLLIAVYNAGSDALRDAMDLAYAIGQRPADVLRVSETDIRNGILHLRQAKTGAAIRYPVDGELGELLARIRERKKQHGVRCLALLVDERGQPMTRSKLRRRFEAARAACGIAGAQFQFRDLRRIAGMDRRDQGGLDAAQALLGHKSQAMTEHYTGARGQIVKPLGRVRKQVQQCGPVPHRQADSRFGLLPRLDQA